jgi:hypothetical protein
MKVWSGTPPLRWNWITNRLSETDTKWVAPSAHEL